MQITYTMWKKLKAYLRRFYNKPLVVQTGKGKATLVNHCFPNGQWLVGRALCLYRHHSFVHVPAEHRVAALENLLQVWSPFVDTGHFAIWRSGEAMVWLWDKNNIDFELCNELQLKSDTISTTAVAPESVFLPEKTEGLYVQACQAGYDLQFWQRGVLLGSQWHSSAPNETEQQLFLRSFGHANSGLAAVEYVNISWLEQPWAKDFAWREWFDTNEWRMGGVAVAVLIVVLLWQEGRYWHATLKADQYSQRVQELSTSLEPLIAARSEIQKLQSWNKLLVSALARPHQVQLMNLVDAALPSGNARFKEWHYQQGSLDMVIEDETAVPVEYIKRLQDVSLFSSVRSEKGRDENTLKIIVEVP